MVTSALVIRDPWIDYILAGRKDWEMRKKPIKKRETIGLIRQGSGLVVGTARIVDSLPALSRADYMDHQDRHAIPEEMLDEVLPSGWVHPWVLADVQGLPDPVPYRHNAGAVTFVSLDPEVAQAIEEQLSWEPDAANTRSQGGSKAGRTSCSTNTAPSSRKSQEPIETMTSAERPVNPGAGQAIKLSAGNVNNGHFYLHSVRHLIPPGGIGGKNKSEEGKLFTVHFDGRTFETDVAGDKMILRKRFTRIFRRLGAKPGDQVRVAMTGEREWVVTFEQAESDEGAGTGGGGRT